MSKKSDVCLALSCRQPVTAVPIWELEFHCWDEASGRHLILGSEFETLTAAQKEAALRVNAEVFAATAEELHFSAVTVPGGYWEIAPSTPAYYWLSPEARFEQIRLLRERCTDMMLIAICSAVLGMPGASEYEEFSYRLFDHPEQIDELAKNPLDMGIEAARKMRDVGIEAVVTASDLADNNGPFYRPEQMTRFVLPYLSDWADEIKDMGLYSVLHTDGNITTLLDDLAATGINALQAIDTVSGMDIAAVKSKVGSRLCICGNLDCGLLQNGPAEQIYEDTKQLLLSCKRGGGFVLGASNAVVKETPVSNYRTMISAWREYGRYDDKTSRVDAKAVADAKNDFSN